MLGDGLRATQGQGKAGPSEKGWISSSVPSVLIWTRPGFVFYTHTEGSPIRKPYGAFFFFLRYIVWWPAHTGNLKLGLWSQNVSDKLASERRCLIQNHDSPLQWSKSLRSSRQNLAGFPHLMTYFVGKLFSKAQEEPFQPFADGPSQETGRETPSKKEKSPQIQPLLVRGVSG